MSGLLLVFILTLQTGTQDILWDRGLQDLRLHISEQSWLPAKVNLDRMMARDPKRFNTEKLFLTRAFIAEKEAKWATALSSYQEEMGDPPAIQKLAMAEAWVELGAHEQALTVLKGIQIRRLPSRDHREKRRFLSAVQYFSLKQYSAAEYHFNWLKKKGRSKQYMLPSYLYLLWIKKIKGHRKSVRLLAERLQTKWPQSDEALESVYIQMDSEGMAYLDRSAMRMGMVGYRNRDYTLSDICFSRVIKKAPKSSRTWAKALYLRSLTHLKREQPKKAAQAFETYLPEFKGTAYEGLAVFQAARALFLLGRDSEVMRWVETRAQRVKPLKWKWESEKLRILALRRTKRNNEFDQMWSIYEKEKAPSWLLTFYHQQGMAQALLGGKPQKARRHFAALPVGSLKKHQKLEMQFWEGLIAQKLDEKNVANHIWSKLRVTHPNHYFGIAANHMLFHDEPLGTSAPIEMKQLLKLETNVHFFSSQDLYARIGRFDWAALKLNTKTSRLSRSNVLVLKAKWFEAAGMPHEAIKLTPAILSFFPRATPMEELPEFLQKLIYPLGFERQVLREARHSKVDPLLLQAIMREETHFKANAKSVSSARGVMQFIPETARRMSLKRFPKTEFNLIELYDPDYSISLGATFLSQLQESFGYYPLFSIAAYNAGEGAVEKWKSLSMAESLTPAGRGATNFDPLLFIHDVTYGETKRYCQKVMASYFQYRRIYLKQEEFPQAFKSRLGG